MVNFGKMLMVLGGTIVLLGALIYLTSKTGFQIGSLPGDFQLRSRNLTCLIPIATSILLSIFLTVVLNIVIRYLNR